jgi:Ca2+-binding EF-hand superfamily protein
MKHWAAVLSLTVASFAPGGAEGREPAVPCRSEAALGLDEDANGDGKVTLLEARAAELALFEHFDQDGDGAVTRSEVDAAAPRWREQRFERRFVELDRDGDGALSQRELPLSARRFVRADRDGDRRLTRAELWTAFERGRGGATDTAALRSKVWRRDLNHDRRVTRTELLVAADRRFMRRDRDGDGVVAHGGEGRRR